MKNGYSCTVCRKLDKHNCDKEYDVVLLSTSVTEETVDSVKSTYKNVIIILLASCIDNATVMELLDNGAHDYILKPFIIEHLIAKIEHYISYELLKRQVDSYSNYLEYIFTDIEDINIFDKKEFPLFISSNNQINIDAYLYKKTNNYEVPIKFISLTDSTYVKKIKNLTNNELVYITDFYVLHGNEKSMFIESISDKKVIVANTTGKKIENVSSIEIKTKEEKLTIDNILSTVNYTKYMIELHQDKMTDVDLSKKLGISRKSIWEKRKKYGIMREKTVNNLF